MAMREYAVYDVAMRPGHDDWITEKEIYISNIKLASNRPRHCWKRGPDRQQTRWSKTRR